MGIVRGNPNAPGQVRNPDRLQARGQAPRILQTLLGIQAQLFRRSPPDGKIVEIIAQQLPARNEGAALHLLLNVSQHQLLPVRGDHRQTLIDVPMQDLPGQVIARHAQAHQHQEQEPGHQHCQFESNRIQRIPHRTKLQ